MMPDLPAGFSLAFQYLGAAPMSLFHCFWCGFIFIKCSIYLGFCKSFFTLQFQRLNILENENFIFL